MCEDKMFQCFNESVNEEKREVSDVEAVIPSHAAELFAFNTGANAGDVICVNGRQRYKVNMKVFVRQVKG